MEKISNGDLVRSIRDLPSLPIVVMELLRSFGQEEANQGERAEKVSRARR